jgi:hypothetical protein
LPGIDEETSYKYLDAVNEYLAEFSPQQFGYTDFDYKILMNPNFRVADNEIFFEITLKEYTDDCD